MGKLVREMSNYVYPYSFTEAKRNNETELYQESQRQNIACKNAIESTIKANYDGRHLNADTAKKVIVEYGYDRVNWVLANTIQHKKYDGRFSSSNKEWAGGFYFPKPSERGSDRTLEYVAESHPAILDGFAAQARKEYDALGLFNYKHCDDKTYENLEGKVLVLRPNMLKDEYKSGDNQLFLAQSGFGCSPTASGRKVFGMFLNDGEETNYNRSEFIGIIEEEYLPQWARDRLTVLSQNDEPAQNGGMSMT